MARLTDREYVDKHYQLRHLWLSHPGAFEGLSMHQQWVIHDFYSPSKNLTEPQLLAHRRAVSEQQPSLPQQAGHALKALAALRRKTVGPDPSHVIAVHNKKLRVRTRVNPEPDIETLAQVYWRLAGQLIKDDGTRSGNAGDTLLDDFITDAGSVTDVCWDEAGEHGN